MPGKNSFEDKLTVLLNESQSERDLRKTKTDIRKVTAISNLMTDLIEKKAFEKTKLTDEQLKDLLGVLQCFFIKNAPVGFNHPQESRNNYYDQGIDRDMSPYKVAKVEHNYNAKPYSDYYRAVDSAKHRLRDAWETELKSSYLKETGKQVYASFDLVVTKKGELLINTIAGLKPAVELSGGTDGAEKWCWFPKIASLDKLLLWINATSAGHQSAFNKAGLNLNLIQTSYLLNHTDTKFRSECWAEPNPHNIEKGLLQPNKLNSGIIDVEVGLFDWAQAQLISKQNYKERLLKHTRDIVSSITREFNQSRASSMEIKVLGLSGKVKTESGQKKIDHDFKQPLIIPVSVFAVPAPSGWLTYPCLILEPSFGQNLNDIVTKMVRALPVEALQGVSDDQIVKLCQKNVVNYLKQELIQRWSSENDDYVSLSNRASFGFANPSIGDVGMAVRIWPGLLPKALIEYKLRKILGLKQEYKLSRLTWSQELEDCPMVWACASMISRGQIAQALRRQEIPLSSAKDPMSPIYRSIKRNANKCFQLTQLQPENLREVEIITTHMSRCLDNLNEYNVVLNALNASNLNEYSDKKLDDMLACVAAIPDRNVTLLNSVITNSGMAAFRQCLTTTGTIPNTGRLYYETTKLARRIKEIVTQDDNYSARCIDLAYNFTNYQAYADELANIQALKGSHMEIEKQGIQTLINIYDATNSTKHEINTNYLNVAGHCGYSRSDCNYILVFESFSKHFQFGADKTTLGCLSVYRYGNKVDERLEKEFASLSHCVLPAAYKNYILEQLEHFYC